MYQHTQNERKPKFSGALNSSAGLRVSAKHFSIKNQTAFAATKTVFVMYFHAFMAWRFLFEVVFQLVVTHGLAKSSKSLCLYLPYALSGNVETLTHFFKRARTSVLQSEAQP